MVGEEQQRTDESTIIRTARVDLGTYGAGPPAYGQVTLPFKRVLAVVGINRLANDTYSAIPIRVVAPNVLRYFAFIAATGVPPGAVAIGEAEVECVLPNE